MKTIQIQFNQAKPFAVNIARDTWKAAYRQQRKQAAKDCKAFVRSMRGEIDASLARVASLANEIHQAIKPQLDAMRETDLFINSGKSLIAFSNGRGKF